MDKIYKRSLYIFRCDLRLHDNPALRYAAQHSESLGCVYLAPSSPHARYNLGPTSIGTHRQRFIDESVLSLSNALRNLNHPLFISQSNSLDQIETFIREYSVEAIFIGRIYDPIDKTRWQQIASRFPDIEFWQIDNTTIFSLDRLPFASDEYPATFSKFRKFAENWFVPEPEVKVSNLPHSFFQQEVLLINQNLPLNTETDKSKTGISSTQQNSSIEALHFRGGEEAGLKHLAHYFKQTHASTYKQTRNALDGWLYSTKFSPWLALGCLSVRQAYIAVRDYEAQHGANESTYWIIFELLWREYFQWYAHFHQSKLYQFGGITGKEPLTSYYAERFVKWVKGQTPWPLVNACMNQLASTGYMSNRGRQIVASCLVNELAIDWRYGAAYFEQQLLDFDAPSNWGNWQYIAGVGADPRGGRQFNIAKQSEQYDPNAVFISRWAPNTVNTPIDSIDAADWPVIEG